MNINPYEAPQDAPPRVQPEEVDRKDSRKDLQVIATYRRMAAMSVLACIVLSLASEYRPVLDVIRQLPRMGLVAVTATAATAGLVSFLAGIVFVCLLAMRVFPVVVGIILGVLSIYPPSGLVVFLVAYWRATRILRANNFRVGLFGAERPPS